jgi:catechol 2,3-dioxygenase-like lactoylglutathione lyase family enzyme
MQEIALSLVVIRSANLERSLHFYKTLGLPFVKEQHGQGPEHYAREIGPTVLEIYPRADEAESSHSVRLGFRVPSVDVALAALTKIGAEIRAGPRNSSRGRRAVVCDPDGHRVEITE